MVSPPHPGPVVIAKELKANIGEVLLYGMIIAIPVTLIAGPFFNRMAQKMIPSAYMREGDISSCTQKNSKKKKCQFRHQLINSYFTSDPYAYFNYRSTCHRS